MFGWKKKKDPVATEYDLNKIVNIAEDIKLLKGRINNLENDKAELMKVSRQKDVEIEQLKSRIEKLKKVVENV